MPVVGQHMTIKHDKAALISELKAQLAKQLQQDIMQVSEEYVVATLLLAEPTVEDCAVLKRQVLGATKLVAYVVMSGAFSPERLETHLQHYLPADLMPAHYLPVSTIPLTATGQIDVEQLAQIAILDADLANRWEIALESVPGVESAAVIIQPQILQPPVIHLSDLLPGWKAAVDKLDAEIVEASHPSEIPPVDRISEVQAWSYGGDLPVAKGLPQTLSEAMTQAAMTALGDRITYLNADSSVCHQSYQGLLEDAERILAGLRQRGLNPQDKVIFQLELSQDILPAFWACILGGYIPVIMGTAPSYRESNSLVDKLCNVWQLLDKPLILTTVKLQPAIQGLTQWLPEESLNVGVIEALRQHKPDQAHHVSQPDDLVFFSLTSGSTGMPKCIGLTHRNLISRAQGTNILCNHNEQDVILNWLPFDHIGSISDWHVRCVLLGCNLVYTAKEYILGRPLNWMDLLDKYRITHSWAPNFAYALVNDNLKQAAEHHWDLSCVRSLLTAGEAVSSNAVEEFINNLAPYGFSKTAVRPAFGMAEMGSGITYYQPTESQPILRHVVDKASLTGYGPIRRVESDHPNCSVFTDLGPVIPGVSIRIVDAQSNVLPEDTVGALQVKGAAVSPGYYKNPEVNKEVFLVDGWFNTGDLGFIANGHLVISGRAKETIIINGANYYNHEIEAVVEEVEGIEVSFTAACAVRDRQAATEKLAIFFSTDRPQGAQLTALLKDIRQTVVAKVALNPDYLIPLAKEEVPKTAIGKIQRSQLAKRFEQGEFDHVLKQVDLLLRNTNTLPDWFFQKIWQPKQLTWVALSQPVNPILVFLDATGVGEQLLAGLNQSGYSGIGVFPGNEFNHPSPDRYFINPAQPDDYQRLLAEIAATGAKVEQMIHLWTLAPPVELPDKALQPHNWESTLELGLYSLLSIVQASAKRIETMPLQILIGSCYSQGIEADEPVVATHAMIPALMKAATQELPWLTCRHLDLPKAPVEQVTFLRQELQTTTALDAEVAYRAGQRLVPRLIQVDWSSAPTQPLPFKQQGFYVITGGLGGVGFEIAQYLLQEVDAKLLLLGRTELPERHSWSDILKQSGSLAQRLQRYQALEDLSSNMHYAAVDLGDVQALNHVVQQMQDRWSTSLDGIIHLAGVATEQAVLEESRISLSATLYPKVAGTVSLQTLALQYPGCLFINFSSVNGFFGGSHTGAYAAANRFLDACSQTLKQQGCQCYNLAWSMWDEIGMSQGFAMKQFTQLQGYYAIPSHQGLQSFLSCLHHQQQQVWIGLDSSKPNVRRYLQAPAVSLQGLKGYFTTETSVLADMASISVEDAFGTPSHCLLQQVVQMPTTATGEIDREKLASLGDTSAADRVEPSTETEKMLATLWQEVLDIPKVGIQDSFFELGGTSLQAAKLFTRIAEVFGQNLPLSTLFEAQTVEAIGQLLMSGGAASSWSSLVKIQSQGSRPPLFCIHGAGGNILMYQELVSYLEPDQPLYGLQAVGLDGGPPITRLQEMATVYVQEMLQVQPTGPYHLLGLSVGGMIALEIARLLESQGHKVALLAMIDSLGPGYPKLLPLAPRLLSLLPYGLTNSLRRIPPLVRKKLSQQKSPFQQKSAPTLASMPPSSMSKAKLSVTEGVSQPAQGFVSNLEQLSLTIFKYSPWAFVVPRFYLESGHHLPTSFQRVQEATVRAFLEYSPKPYSGDVLFFRASQQPPGCYKDATLGWDKVIQGHLEICDVPGCHGESLLYKSKSLTVIGPRLYQALVSAQRLQHE